jgi:ATP phosphoribosyltransferase
MRKKRQGAAGPDEPVVVAVPKGRVLEQLAPKLRAAGLDGDVLLAQDRRLIREDPRHGLRYLLLKPDDVPTYVEYGAADVGIVGRDVLLEREYDLYAPVDLGIGRCRMMVAGLPSCPYPEARGRTIRVATKFPNVAARHFLAKGQPVEILFVQGSVELAPLTGLSDCIVDLVESGETLARNGLQEIELVCDVTSVVVANRVGLKLKRDALAPFLDALRG